MDLVRTRVRGRDHSEFGERIHGELRETEKNLPVARVYRWTRPKDSLMFIVCLLRLGLGR